MQPLQQTLVVGDITAVLYPHPSGNKSRLCLFDNKRCGSTLHVTRVGSVAHPQASRQCSSFFTVFSPDGTLGASCFASNHGGVLIWSTLDGSVVVHHTSMFLRSVNQVAFSPDGTLLAAGSGCGRIVIFGGPSWRPITCEPTNNGAVGSLSFSPCGKFLAMGGGLGARNGVDELVIFNVCPDAEKNSRDRNSNSDAPRGGGTGALPGVGNINLYPPPSTVVPQVGGFLTVKHKTGATNGHIGTIRTVCWSSDGRWIVTASGDGAVGLFRSADPSDHLKITTHSDTAQIGRQKVEAAWLFHHPTLRCNCIVSCDFDGNVMLHTVDLRATTAASSNVQHLATYKLHPKPDICYSVSGDWHRNNTTLISAGNDARVAGVDVLSGAPLLFHAATRVGEAPRFCRDFVPTPQNGIQFEVSPHLWRGPHYKRARPGSADEQEEDGEEMFHLTLAACMSWSGDVPLFAISRALALGETTFSHAGAIVGMSFRESNNALVLTDSSHATFVVSLPRPEQLSAFAGPIHIIAQDARFWRERAQKLEEENAELRQRIAALEKK